MTLIAANQSLDSEVLIDLIQIKTNEFDIKICNYGSVSFVGFSTKVSLITPL
jgi:hypothetical protein